MSHFTIGFIGFGLIGGSIARVRRKIHPKETIIAYNYRNASNPNLEEALADGVLSRIETSLEPFSECSIIFLCAPVLTNISYLEKLKPIVNKKCIITDVGSVKGNIHAAVSALGLERQFIGGHPMAGAEKTSYHYSSASLLENSYYILTPTEKTPNYMKELLQRVIEELNAEPVFMDPATHDEAVAAISHIPHIAAASLVNLVRSQEQADIMKRLSAGGFKDITRIASSSSEMWQNICLSNKESILKLLLSFQGNISDVISMLEKEDKDGLYQFFSEAKKFRDSVPDKSQTPLGKLWDMT